VNGSIQGPGASAASPDVVSYSKQIVAAMGGTVSPGPQLSSDQLNKTGARQGQVPGSTALVGNGGGQAPPNLVVDTQSGQLYSEDGQPYLGKALFLKGDETVVDAAGNAVDLAALERAAGYNPDLITAATGGTQAYGNGQEPPEIFTGPQGNIVTADGQPYLGMQLFMQDDQTVVDGQGNQVNLAELEQAAGYAPPPPPAPPQFYRGPNDQLVDIAGQPYLGVTMFVRGEQVLDANGMAVDLNAVIAQAGYDPNAEAVPDAPLDPVQTDASQYPPPGAPQTDLPKGEGKGFGIVRNLLALGGDYHRWRQSTLPPEPDATTKAKRKPRTNVPPLPKDHKSRKSGAAPAPTTVKPTAKTKSTKVNPDAPVAGTRDMRITRQAQQEFRARKQDILNSYSGTAKLPREALQLTDGQRTRMRIDVREHMTASKQFKEAFVNVQKWNKRDPGTLTTTEHRSMVRDQQTLEMAQKAVQKTEVKINGWYKKIGKKPIDDQHPGLRSPPSGRARRRQEGLPDRVEALHGRERPVPDDQEVGGPEADGDPAQPHRHRRRAAQAQPEPPVVEEGRAEDPAEGPSGQADPGAEAAAEPQPATRAVGRTERPEDHRQGAGMGNQAGPQADGRQGQRRQVRDHPGQQAERQDDVDQGHGEDRGRQADAADQDHGPHPGDDRREAAQRQGPARSVGDQRRLFALPGHQALERRRQHRPS
jgi:hypothetical protein